MDVVVPKRDYFEKGQFTDLTYLVLTVLIRPCHGYLIMNEVACRTNNEVAIGPATLYAMLRKLTDFGFIQPKEDSANRKTYQITDEGLVALRIEIDKRRRLAEYGEEALRAYKEDQNG
jgi:DNA-binding PadR family transcriptional regulator